MRPLHPDFGVELVDVDLTSLDSNAFVEVERVVEEHSVVLAAGQRFDDDSQVAFTRRFGELEHNHVKLGQSGVKQYFYRIGNIDDEGNQLPSDDRHVRFSTGNEMWHSDSSFRPVPAKLSISHAKEVSAEGGELEFVSTRAAYRALPDALKEKLSGLAAVHDYVFSRSKVGADVVAPSHAESLPPVRQKLVRRNPTTGDLNYYIGSHARDIVGWSWEASRELLDELLERATAPGRIYTHRWSPGDLLIWDNRCVLHRGRPFDADRHRRRMHQTRALCESSTLEEA